MTTTRSLSLEAKEYIEKYRSKISDKFLQQNKEKQVMNVLQMSPEEQQEVTKRMREDLRQFIQELQLDKDYEKFIQTYHKDMANVRHFSHRLYGDGEDKKDIIKNYAKSKHTFFTVTPKQWKMMNMALESVFADKSPEEMTKLQRKTTEKIHDKARVRKLKHIGKVVGFYGICGGTPLALCKLRSRSMETNHEILSYVAFILMLITLLGGSLFMGIAMEEGVGRSEEDRNRRNKIFLDKLDTKNRKDEEEYNRKQKQ